MFNPEKGSNEPEKELNEKAQKCLKDLRIVLEALNVPDPEREPYIEKFLSDIESRSDEEKEMRMANIMKEAKDKYKPRKKQRQEQTAQEEKISQQAEESVDPEQEKQEESEEKQEKPSKNQEDVEEKTKTKDPGVIKRQEKAKALKRARALKRRIRERIRKEKEDSEAIKKENEEKINQLRQEIKELERKYNQENYKGNKEKIEKDILKKEEEVRYLDLTEKIADANKDLKDLIDEDILETIKETENKEELSFEEKNRLSNAKRKVNETIEKWFTQEKPKHEVGIDSSSVEKLKKQAEIGSIKKNWKEKGELEREDFKNLSNFISQEIQSLENKSEENIKAKIAEITDLQKGEISVTEQEVFKEEVKLHYGDINFNKVRNEEEIKFPENFIGSLGFVELKKAKNIELPKNISNLFLDGLETAKNLDLPPGRIDHLSLNGLKKAKGLNFPKDISISTIFLNNLRTIKGLNLPENFEGKVYARKLSKKKKQKLEERYPGATIE